MVGPGEELFRFHLAQVGELGGYLLGRRLYETMSFGSRVIYGRARDEPD